MSRLVAAVPADAVDAVRAAIGGDYLVRPMAEFGSADFSDAMADVECVLLDATKDPRLGATLKAMPSLRFVQTLIAGTDWIEPLIPAGVELSRPEGARDNAVAEWVLSALLGVASGLLSAAKVQSHAKWDDSLRRPTPELRGQHVVVVGHGGIGRQTVRLLEALGVRVTAVARRTRENVLPFSMIGSVLADADALVLLVPADASTHHLVGDAILSQMKPGSLLVNAERGSVVDSDALLRAIRSTPISAVLDVTDPEPLPPEHPLWSEPGCFISPHIAGSTWAGRSRPIQCAIEAFTAYAQRDSRSAQWQSKERVLGRA